MPAKVFHQTNPTDPAKWEALPDHDDFYAVNDGHVVAVPRPSRTYKVDGRSVTETTLGDTIHAGSIVPAKAFGPGADLQRHVDNGAIRQATPWEVDELRKNFAKDAGRTTAAEGKATVAPDPVVTDDPDRAKHDADAKAKADAEAKAKTDAAKK
jgi:hypothetical protein